ncbi:MAG TPA: PQQ-dependent sugar dehydrogenase [Candidatus Binatia bacterium]|nr:PQQ-dependent sugar dehydrogenase [Candidatus Binatia bacterium]
MRRLPVAVLAALVLLPAAAEPQPRVETVVGGLQVPWALAFAPDGSLWLTERPGRIRVVRDGRLDPRPVATLPAAAVGEGGLMGLALDPDFTRTGWLYTCYTMEKSGGLINRIVRLTVRDGRAGEERVLVDDIPGASVHDGCRLKFGPDGKLYATTGDAGRRQLSQQRDSLAGKILRMNSDGSAPADNPFPGSLVWALGIRNSQGIAWDPAGRLWASEHGPSGFPGGHDEINLIEPGKNYGWPEVYGKGEDSRFVDPVIESGRSTWAPGGIAVLDDHLYVACLRGRRLLRMAIRDGRIADVSAWLGGTHGRLRDVVVGPDGALYVATSNRDGRGTAADDDDRVLRVRP